MRTVLVRERGKGSTTGGLSTPIANEPPNSATSARAATVTTRSARLRRPDGSWKIGRGDTLLASAFPSWVLTAPRYDLRAMPRAACRAPSGALRSPHVSNACFGHRPPNFHRPLRDFGGSPACAHRVGVRRPQCRRSPGIGQPTAARRARRRPGHGNRQAMVASDTGGTFRRRAGRRNCRTPQRGAVGTGSYGGRGCCRRLRAGAHSDGRRLDAGGDRSAPVRALRALGRVAHAH